MKTLFLVVVLALAAPLIALGQDSSTHDCAGVCVTAQDCKDCKKCPYCNGATQACLVDPSSVGDSGGSTSSSSSKSKRSTKRPSKSTPKRQPSGHGHPKGAHR